MAHSETHHGREFWCDESLGGYVLGGRDAFGFVPGIYRWLLERFECIAIPMKGKMESLNVAAAGAILMYALRPA